MEANDVCCECPNCGAVFTVAQSGSEDGADECPFCGWGELIYLLNDETSEEEE